MFPAASQIIFGINALAIRADFSLSTIATDLSGYNVNRCSPKKHCCKLKYSGSAPDFFSLLCTQSIASLCVIFLPGEIAIYGLIIFGFANSVLWGTIWPLAIADLGKFTKKGASAKTSIGYRKCDARRAGLREG